MEKIQIRIDRKSYSVIGDEFWSMLEHIKAIPSRTFGTIGGQRVWEVPGSLEDVQQQLQPLQVLDDEGLLQAELADIGRVQARLLELAPTIEQRIQALDREMSGYSFRSKSSVKAGLAHDSSLLAHALENAGFPVEQLTEPQIKGMYAALKLMEGR
jgi:hypothetical protein